ncbi:MULTISPECIES: helix-turn-helix transcriptional regulator [Paraburkholderia]|jgi:prophage regulatory protein|nr:MULTISPECIES: AlpA family transcriptional regulator [Paraburkholderia]KFX64347.1 AlpA family transcriptional regulator [Burkholderia sp. K24]MDE1012102.1 AlpA family transcriptional regulator [Paraburkholderia fungorum]MDT8835905.1 AlpA family transcriptional regulator [Paraburkholderia fungorum]PNE56902.1 AlpA family transcriptional regulator [Paraburkholderia fungorum]PZR50601.1 MAG: AlpA family transcriptional regulator [Paraburkholderia fungorum]
MNDEHIGGHESAKSRLIRLPEVRMRVSLGASTVYRYLAAGKFPRPVEIGGGRVAWYESEIDAWIASRKVAGTRVSR